MKNKEQAYYIIGAIILFAVLYFGFSSKPSSQKALEKSRAISTQEYDITTYQVEAKKSLKKDEVEYLDMLEAQAAHSDQDTAKVNTLKQLSGYWFKLKNPVMAGFYAKQIAEVESTGTSWAITGTTFAAGLKMELDDKLKLFARNQALNAFEKAISLEPRVIDHRVNQALCYIEVPEAGEPMKGIQMLAGLATSYPESPAPPYQLARLAVQTRQYERAQTRIEQALKLAPQDQRIACLAVEIYTALNKPTEAQEATKVCGATQ